MKKVNIIYITIFNCFVILFSSFLFTNKINVQTQENEPWY
jgi:hypothetical protein